MTAPPLLNLAQGPWNKRGACRKQWVEKAQEPRPKGKEAETGPTPSIFLLVGGRDQAGQDGWVGGNLRQGPPGRHGPWVAAILADHYSLLADEDPAVGSSSAKGQEPPPPSYLLYWTKH